MSRPEIDFDPNISEARRERTERAVMSRLAVIQALGESDVVLAPPPTRFRWAAIGLAVAVAATLLLWLVRRDPHVQQVAESSSLVVTPIGGSSRFTVGDALVDAGGDTSVEVTRESGGGIALLLTRGSVDCDVTPRVGRAPFRVLAGDVTVEVIGTRFEVTRTGSVVRVDVTRGKVRVKTPFEERMLEAGGSWTLPVIASVNTPSGGATALPARVDAIDGSGREVASSDGATPRQQSGTEPPIETPAPAPQRPSFTKRPSSREAFASAQRLEPKDRAEAARTYRAIANGADVWAALSLYSLAELHATHDPASALAVLDELARRFPDGANAEDAAWLRVNVLRKLSRHADARQAAASYLRKYPNGTYVIAAERLTSP